MRTFFKVIIVIAVFFGTLWGMFFIIKNVADKYFANNIPEVTQEIIPQQNQLSSSKETEEPKVEETETPVEEVAQQILSVGYYGNQLTDEERQVYLACYNACLTYQNTVPINGVGFANCEKACNALRLDRPELYFFDNLTVSHIGNEVVSITINIPPDANEIMIQIDQAAQNIISGCASDDNFTKIKYYYDYLALNTNYNHADITNPRNQYIQSCLLDHNTVCAGYSKAFKYLCDKSGVPCIYISGYANREGHAWNLVKINGNNYYVDTTWGDADYSNENTKNIFYEYFCCDEASLVGRSIDVYGFKMPKCNSGCINVYEMEGNYLNSQDLNQLYAIIGNQIGQTNNIFIKCADDSIVEWFRQYYYNNYSEFLSKLYELTGKTYDIEVSGLSSYNHIYIKLTER